MDIKKVPTKKLRQDLRDFKQDAARCRLAKERPGLAAPLTPQQAARMVPKFECAIARIERELRARDPQNQKKIMHVHH